MFASTVTRNALGLSLLLAAIVVVSGSALASIAGVAHADAPTMPLAASDLGPAVPSRPSALCGPPEQCVFITLGTSNGVGTIYPTDTFTPSPAVGATGPLNHLFFRICDFALDHTANVTIDDTNATRDGLTNPVLSVSLPLKLVAGSGCPGGTSYDSTQAPQYFFTIPATLALGGGWTFNVTANTASSSEHQQAFQVQTYYVQLTVDQGDHLPGDHATVYYQVLSELSQGPVTGTLAFAINGVYVNSTRPLWHAPVPGLAAPSTGAQGSVAFTVPLNAQVDTPIQVNLWANLTVGSGTNSEMSVVTYLVAEVGEPELCASTNVNGGAATCPANLAFPVGSELVVREIAYMSEPTADGGELATTIPGATITIQLLENGIPVTAPASFPTQVSADDSGTAREVLDTTGITASAITLNVTVSDPLDPGLTNASSLTITLLGASSQVAVNIQLNASQYFGGDTLGGTYQLVLPGGTGTVPPFWVAYAYQVWYTAGSVACPGGVPGAGLQVQGNLSGSAGTLPGYTLGLTMNGIVVIVIYAHNGSSASTTGIESLACAVVSPPQILVNPSEVNYFPGDSISVSVVGEGSVLTKGNPTYFGNVVGFAVVTGHDPCTGTTMQVLYGGTFTGGSFSFTVPKLGTSVCYELSVSAQTSAGLITGENVELDEEGGFSLSAFVATVSSYTDGSFQPGQSISLDYSVSPLGNAVLPQSVTLLVQVEGQPIIRNQQASTSGSFSVTIPSTEGAGVLLIQVEAEVTDPNFAGGVDDVVTTTGVLVHPNPSLLDEELGAGSGFTFGELFIVILIVALVIVGVLFWRRSQWKSSSSHFQHEHGPSGEVPPPPGADAVAPPPDGTASGSYLDLPPGPPPDLPGGPDGPMPGSSDDVIQHGPPPPPPPPR